MHVPLDAPTIQGSLVLALTGDEIIVAPGTYRENVRCFGTDVVLRSSDPGDPDTVASTVIDGDGWGPVVSFTGAESEAFVLSGLTITNGKGGGICGGTRENHAQARVARCVITDNDGGALSFCDGVIENNTISRNSYTGDLSPGGALYDCDGVIRGNTISDNRAGFGACLTRCDGTIQDNTIRANPGYGLANCMAVIRSNTVSNHTQWGLWSCGGTIEGNIISGNSSGGLSGCHGLIRRNTVAANSGPYSTGGMSHCEGTIENNLIYGNSCAGSKGGGALNECVGIIQNNAIIGNSAENGGGLYKCLGTIRSNTIIANTAYYGGGGVYVCLGTIRNCVIWGNTAWYGAQVFASSEPTYSCIEGWQEGGPGNTSDDPLFLDADGQDDDPETYEDNDYRLDPGSPCINAGLNEPWMWEAVDLDGNPRVAQGRVDMGAYEHGSTAFMLLRLQPALGGGTELMWSSEPEASYAVWSRASLSTAPWTLEVAIDSQGRLTRWTDPATSARAKFYRVELK